MSRYVVTYTQQYYTVDLNAPANPSSVLASSVPLSDVESHMDDAHPPTYVSSVTYGRLVIFTFESEYSSEEMSAALAFAYSGGVDVSGSVSVSYEDIISNAKITAFILGGDAGTAVQAINSYDALIAFIQAGGNYSVDSPGAPIAYKLNYLADNSPARMSETDNYDVQNCTRVSQQVQVTLDSIEVDGGGDLQIYGDITAVGTGTAAQSLFHKTGDDYVDIKQGTQFAPGTQTIVEVDPQPGQTLTLSAHLVDHNKIFSDSDLGTEISINPYESGWHKDVSVILTGSGDQVKVTFTLTPI
jgi:hypothetical protein